MSRSRQQPRLERRRDKDCPPPVRRERGNRRRSVRPDGRPGRAVRVRGRPGVAMGVATLGRRRSFKKHYTTSRSCYPLHNLPRFSFAAIYCLILHIPYRQRMRDVSRRALTGRPSSVYTRSLRCALCARERCPLKTLVCQSLSVVSPRRVLRPPARGRAERTVATEESRTRGPTEDGIRCGTGTGQHTLVHSRLCRLLRSVSSGHVLWKIRTALPRDGRSSFAVPRA